MAGGVHGRGACVAGGHVWLRACMAIGIHGGGTCVAWGVHGRRDGNCNGRYTSHWNAFLSLINQFTPLLILHLIQSTNSTCSK